MSVNDRELDPTPLRAGAGSAGRLLGKLPDPAPLPPDAVERIHRRAVGVPSRAAARPRLRWWAIASVCLAGGATAATVVHRILPAEPRVERVATPTRTIRGPARSAPVIEPLAPVAEEPVVDEPPRAAPRQEARPARPAPRPAAAPVVEAPVPPASALAEESRLLELALRRLRRDGDPRAAIAALDEHRARFPRGELAQEADRTRVEALLLQGRPGPALEAVDRMTFGSSLRDLELVVARGELRARAGRCAEAEADFTNALAKIQSGPAAERALYGRASCRSRRGDADGARADLARYVAKFPDGKFAAEARRALGDR